MADSSTDACCEKIISREGWWDWRKGSPTVSILSPEVPGRVWVFWGMATNAEFLHYRGILKALLNSSLVTTWKPRLITGNVNLRYDEFRQFMIYIWNCCESNRESNATFWRKGLWSRCCRPLNERSTRHHWRSFHYSMSVWIPRCFQLHTMSYNSSLNSRQRSLI